MNIVKMGRPQLTRVSSASSRHGMQHHAIASTASVVSKQRTESNINARAIDAIDPVIYQTRSRARSNETGADRLAQNCQPVYATDEEIGKILLGNKDWKTFIAIAPTLEREGLPPRRALFLNRRHLQAVLRFFERREIITDAGTLGHAFLADDGPENFE